VFKQLVLIIKEISVGDEAVRWTRMGSKWTDGTE